MYTRVGNESLVPDFLDIPHLLCTVYSTVHDVPQDYIIPYSILRKISWYFLEISSANNSIIENTVGISHEIFTNVFSFTNITNIKLVSNWFDIAGQNLTFTEEKGYSVSGKILASYSPVTW